MWNKVSELPKENMRLYLVYVECEESLYMDVAYFDDGEWFIYDFNDDVYSARIEPTHWMNLPDKPTAEIAVAANSASSNKQSKPCRIVCSKNVGNNCKSTVYPCKHHG